MKHFKIFIFLLVFSFSNIWAATTPSHIQLRNITELTKLLQVQGNSLQSELARLHEEHEQFVKSRSTYAQVAAILQQVKIREKMAAIAVRDLQQELASARQQDLDLNQRQAELQEKLLSSREGASDPLLLKRSGYIMDLIQKNKSAMEWIQENLKLSETLNHELTQYITLLETGLGKIKTAQEVQALEKKIEQVRLQMDYWLSQLDAVTQKMNQPTERLTSQIASTGALFYINQQLRLNKIKITSLSFEIRQQELAPDFWLPQHALEYKQVKEKLEYDSAVLQSAIEALDAYKNLQTDEEAVLTAAFKNKLITAGEVYRLKRDLQGIKVFRTSLAATVAVQKSRITEKLLKLQEHMKLLVAQRQGFFKIDKDGWRLMFDEMVHLPHLLFNYVLSLSTQMVQAFQLMQTLSRSVLFLLAIGWGSVWFFGRKYYGKIEKLEQNRQRMSSNVMYITLQLIRRNLGGLCLFFAFFMAFRWMHLNINIYVGLIYLALTWFSFRMALGIARFILVEHERDILGYDVKLYYHLRRVFFFGWIVATLAVVAHQLIMNYDIQEMFDRLVMLFLLIVSIVLLRGRDVIPSLLQSFIKERRIYLSRAIQVLCWLLPLAILFNALMGLLGYITLAATLGYYFAILVVLIAGYIMVRGILIDLLDIGSEWMIHHLQNGWLWCEAFLKPLDKILRIGVFLLAGVVAFLIFGWDLHSLVVLEIQKILTYPVFIFASAEITLLSGIEFIVLVALFLWTAKWTREFTYRWLLREVQDLGVRNSLAVFSQYTVITVGSIVTLRVLGVDFSGLSMILGGLAVGLGFGLRDFAGNIVGGLLLLIERPVRKGDVVCIGGIEGEVTHIGIRAIRMRSWDHVEVLIPNTEIYTKIFTNWTHQDNIVRTVLSTKHHHEEDPILVQKLILETLCEIPEIVKDPVPGAYLKQISESLIEFEIRYFSNVILYSQHVVRSKVLLAISEKLKVAGVKPPYPQQELYVQSRLPA